MAAVLLWVLHPQPKNRMVVVSINVEYVEVNGEYYLLVDPPFKVFVVVE